MVRKAPSREPERGVSSRPHLPCAEPSLPFVPLGALLWAWPFADSHPLCGVSFPSTRMSLPLEHPVFSQPGGHFHCF